MALAARASLPPFRNEPIRRFASAEERSALAAALAQVRADCGGVVPLVIDGRPVERAARIPSRDPAHPRRVVGEVVAGGAADVDAALEAATRAFASWSRTPVAARAELLLRAAAALRERRDRFDALMVVEVGKPPFEADADTAEAIDFLEFYAREALRLAEPRPLVPSPLPEDTELRYLPLGVGAIIPPWNFPLAIATGMTAAAIVTGNTVVLKPSPDAAVVAARLVDLLHAAGLPPGVVNFVPGDAFEVGERLVTDPRTRFVSFTGSKAVGLRINELAARTPPGQRWIKRVVAELGGKDAIVVADDADLDAALDGVVVSAFGFAGQKCSACSRAIVDRRVYDRFVERLAARADALVVGDPADPRTDVGPLINERAREKFLRYDAIGRAEGRLVAGGGAVEGAGLDGGWYVRPTVVADVAPEARIAQEEIFGPYLAVLRADDFEHALALANGTDFGLTGAVYTRDPVRLERAKDAFFVGNLYLNRKCTGALVGVHPFGGFNLSGTDAKAGGSDHLLLFLQAKAVATARPPLA